MQLSARSVVQGGTMGPHRSPVKGASLEFRQHRFYVPGDEPRRLGWRVVGRTGAADWEEGGEEGNLWSGMVVGARGAVKYCGGGGGECVCLTKFVAGGADLIVWQRAG